MSSLQFNVARIDGQLEAESRMPTDARGPERSLNEYFARPLPLVRDSPTAARRASSGILSSTSQVVGSGTRIGW